MVAAGMGLGGAEIAGADPGPIGLAVGLTLAGIGSLAPDIDHPDSWIGSRIPATLVSTGLLLLLAPILFALGSRSGGLMSGVWDSFLALREPMLKWGVVALGLGVVMFIVSKRVTRAVQHRGPTHSLLLAVAVTLISFVIALAAGLGPWLGMMFGVGWISHLMADAITPKGVPSLLWPLSSGDASGTTRWFGFLLAPLLLGGVFGWYQSFDAASPSPASTVLPASTASSTSADVLLARQRLREASPEIERALINPETPEVSSSGSLTTYKWQYSRQDDAGVVSTKSIAITLDSAGHIVGATQR